MSSAGPPGGGSPSSWTGQLRRAVGRIGIPAGAASDPADVDGSSAGAGPSNELPIDTLRSAVRALVLSNKDEPVDCGRDEVLELLLALELVLTHGFKRKTMAHLWFSPP